MAKDGYITVKIHVDDLYDMLCERVERNTDDWRAKELFENYYSDMVYDSDFADGMELNIAEIVDNDMVNNFRVMSGEDILTEILGYNEDDWIDRGMSVDDFLNENTDVMEEFNELLGDRAFGSLENDGEEYYLISRR